MPRKEFNLNALCPTCGNKLDWIMNVMTDDDPKPGDISLCARCGKFHQFTKDMQAKKLSNEELFALPKKTQITLVIMRVAWFRLQEQRKAN